MRNWKTFTEEEVKALRAHPYVKNATTKMIRFTTEFKEEFWRRHKEECKPPRKIVEEMGLDPELLGQGRIEGILIHLRDQMKMGEPFRDVRKVPKGRTILDDQDLTPSKALLRMQHQIAYLDQEIEFIKKLSHWTKRTGGHDDPISAQCQIRDHPRDDHPRQ